MSLYASYIKERLGKHIIESDYGFATYSFTPDGIYIEDVFVSQAFRKSGLAVEFEVEITKIAKEKGLSRLYTSVAVDTPDCSENLARLIKHGAKLKLAKDNTIYVVKEI